MYGCCKAQGPQVAERSVQVQFKISTAQGLKKSSDPQTPWGQTWSLGSTNASHTRLCMFWQFSFAKPGNCTPLATSGCWTRAAVKQSNRTKNGASSRHTQADRSTKEREKLNVCDNPRAQLDSSSTPLRNSRVIKI